MNILALLNFCLSAFRCAGSAPLRLSKMLLIAAKHNITSEEKPNSKKPSWLFQILVLFWCFFLPDHELHEQADS